MVSVMLFALFVSSAAPPLGSPGGQGPARDYPIRPVPFTKVSVQDPFWTPRLETNRTVTIPYDLEKCRETGRIDNFARAAGLAEGPFVGYRFNDSDLYKVIEGAATSLALRADPALDRRLDEIIALIAGAQEDDGYLYCTRTIDPEHPVDTPPGRWSDLGQSHELYNVGHLYEAAVAHFMATGKKTLLDVARKSADLVYHVFAEQGHPGVPGHEEIEIGLVKLYRATGEGRYLELAKLFLDRRGRGQGRALYGPYCQDHIPVTEQTQAVGHSVRAGYLYCGMADVAALTGDADYIKAIDAIWNDVATSKLYITGGIGARRGGEAFGDPYELPNKTAYNETCAAIANILWNHRMFLMHGEGKYIDVLERTLYNGFLSGISLHGDTFFYPNPLESDGVFPFNQGATTRKPWFGCACCPVNVVRLLPQIAGMVYARRDADLYVNLYVSGTTVLDLAGARVKLTQATRYPWEGRVEITVETETPAAFTLHLRLPGWARGEPVPGDLYRYARAQATDARGPKDERVGPSIAVDGEQRLFPFAAGYAVIERHWSGRTTVVLDLPMPIRRVLAADQVADDRGRAAVEKGPVVYCAEGVDNDGRVRDLVLPLEAGLEAEWRGDLLGGVAVIHGEGVRLRRTGDGALAEEAGAITLVPYHVWSHRGPGEMQVWLAHDKSAARPLPVPTLASRSRASASHTWAGDTVEAVHDLEEPDGSADHSIPRHTFWDHRGAADGRSIEWLQYDLPGRARLSATSVYWFDDRPGGGCRVPASWRLLYRTGGMWREVKALDDYGVERDRYNQVRFEPIETDAVRVEVTLQPGFSSGVLEWTLETPGEERHAR